MENQPYSFGRAAVQRGRLFSLLFAAFFGFIFLDTMIVRFNILPSSFEACILLKLTGETCNTAAMMAAGIMSIIGFILFAFATFLLRKYR